MPIDKYYRPEQRVSSYSYQLGWGRPLGDDRRNPRVAYGSPRVCNRLESLIGPRNPSTNFAISFEESLRDDFATFVARQYVEDVLLVGVQSSEYAYTLVLHDEDDENCKREAETKPVGHRTAIHGKIINLHLPSGRKLQPIYPTRERMLPTLYLSWAAIKYGLASPFDAGRERNSKSFFRYGETLAEKQRIDQSVKSASRLPDGTPDVVSVIDRLSKVFDGEVAPISGIGGRKGVQLTRAGSTQPLRFFGPHFATLHNHVTQHEEHHDEHGQTNRDHERDSFFPEGKLCRTSESTARIARALDEWRSKRAVYHARRYNLERTAMVDSPLPRYCPSPLGRDHRLVGLPLLPHAIGAASNQPFGGSGFVPPLDGGPHASIPPPARNSVGDDPAPWAPHGEEYLRLVKRPPLPSPKVVDRAQQEGWSL